ncbi:hypothetical protein D9M09_17920 [Janthinobacterium agaricidamnosum]|uniref:Uncharacterized protein n=1 Tax=Janthinobacterium agaricidamnosum TaxID=55508 RepID=A0A3G2EBX2_9BURK|nr:hypothetical protein D9M09_17920 [Janthinobacterium agaricidamnosum]
MQQGIPVAIPGRQIGGRERQDLVQIRKARIGIESKFTAKYAVTFRSRFINVRNQHICKIKRIAEFNREFVCAFLAAQPYSGM